MQELVTEKGYAISSHWVTTPDGYILNLFNIPHGRGKGVARQSLAVKPVVFLNHALLDSSFAFVCNSAEQSLAFVLADAGYDVWMTNNRGNTYSTNHTSLRPSSPAFWDFTYDDMALQDLPTGIDYVLRTTGAARLAGYVGHSQGTIQAFAGFTRNHSLAARVGVMVAMAPVAWVDHEKSKGLRALGKLDVEALWGRKGFLQAGGLNSAGSFFCRFIPGTCDSVIEAIVGPSGDMNKTRTPVYIAHTPAGTSVKNMRHWAQGIDAHVFQEYDEGSAAKNQAKYGRPTPPPYDLSSFPPTLPVVLVTGGNDYLADPEDVLTLAASLPAGVLQRIINVPQYSHLDFTWGVHAHTLVYPGILEALRNASRTSARAAGTR